MTPARPLNRHAPDGPPPDRHSRESGNPPPPRIVVTGTIGLDTVETPFGRVEAALGGSASYFALAASLYSSVSVVSVVGEDFPAHYQELLTRRRIDLSSVARLPGQTFRWGGRYRYDPQHQRHPCSPISTY